MWDNSRNRVRNHMWDNSRNRVGDHMWDNSRNWFFITTGVRFGY